MLNFTEFENLRKWNSRLGKHFFREELAGQEILLFVTRKLLNEVGQDLGGTAGLLRAVAARKPPYQNWGLCRFALHQHEKWRSNPLGVDYPPYLAYLAVFVLAAADQAEHLSANAYYPHLAVLLDNPGAGAPAGFDRMDVLWKDVGWWANERQHERLGRFTFRRRGHLAHVGLPQAQTLLSREERDALPGAFEAADLCPGEQVPEARLAQLLLRRGGNWLQARTGRLLRSAAPAGTDEATMRAALLELVQEELTNWDGHAPQATAETALDPRPLRAGLRLFVRDQGLGQVAVRLRFRAAQELPDAELQLRQGTLQLSCYGLPGGGGWTSELAQPDGAPYNAAAHDWQRPLALHDAEQGYTARLRGGPVRLLLPAARQGLPAGWLEAESLADDGAFRLLVHDQAWEKVRAWGEAHCGQFRAVAAATVPAGWRWVEARQPRQDCADVPALTRPARTTARLMGGLRTESRGNEFLRFALPRLVLGGVPTGSIGVLNDARPLARLTNELTDAETGFALPNDLAADQTHWLEVRQGEQMLLRRAVRISEGYCSKELPSFGRGPAGNAIAPAGQWACGAMVEGVDEAAVLPFPRPLPTHLARTLILLGEQPGQVAEWPAQPAPTAWQPVWAVARLGRDRWQPIFCGTSAQLEAGRPGRAVGGGASRKAWGQATYGQRRHTIRPQLEPLAQLWKAYHDAGKAL